ncbi:hypothetical protein N5C46_22885 [Rossellomorea vietnamensis]|uniref:Uncharacterized protein n=1 Tax=Rossellomorea vietnamensis TaxID=218284 RepID=A0ACD4C7Y1_9BACI|nr:hypothetical protein [Rossellomorea vietnamensis]UXH44426.1 hypothetical protein N5C46_22885 [Rossellomorea vietnamensis]
MKNYIKNILRVGDEKMIYQKYTEVLLRLHESYHQLVLMKFNNVEDFNTDYWLTQIDEQFRDKILFTRYQALDNTYYFKPQFKFYDSKKYGVFFIEYRSYTGKISKNIFNNTVKYISYLKRTFYDEKLEEKLSNLVKPNSNNQFWNAKQSLFDFYVSTGNRYHNLYGGDATHYNLILDLLEHSNYINCLRIWRGDDIIDLIEDDDERDALTTLSLLMFEQEVNYGRYEFQQNTNFFKDESKKKYYRSRDMLMGFINMAFSDTKRFNDYPHWEKANNQKAYPHFGKGEKLGFKNLNDSYLVYFTEFNKEKKYKDVKSLMEVNNYLFEFRSFVRNSGQNPHFNGLTL